MPPSASGSEVRPPVRRREALLLALLLAAALGWRLLHFVGVNGGDDPAYSEAALIPLPSLLRDLVWGGPVPFRVGLLRPTTLAYLLWGPCEGAAAVYPLLCATGSVFLAWWLGRRISGPAAGWLAGGIVALCPHAAGWSSVLSPDIPMGFWLSCAAVLLWEGGGMPLLLASGFCFGLGVATRESAFGLLPLVLGAAWFRGRSLPGILAFAAAVLTGMCAWTGDARVPSGIWQYLSGPYLARNADNPGDLAAHLASAGQIHGWPRVWDAVRMILPGDYRFQAFGGIAVLGLAAGLGALCLRRPSAWLGAWALGYGLVILLGASPRSPGMPLIPVQPRYLEPILVPLAVLCAIALLRLPGRLLWGALPLWGLYLAYGGWLCGLQDRSTARPLRPAAAWIRRHPQEGTVYARPQEAAILGVLLGHPAGPRLLAASRPSEGEVVQRWQVPEEAGPRILLGRLLGKPVPPPERDVVLVRQGPGALYLKTR